MDEEESKATVETEERRVTTEETKEQRDFRRILQIIRVVIPDSQFFPPSSRIAVAKS